MNRARLAIVLALAIVGVGGAWHHFHASSDPARLTTADVSVGDIVQAVACTGTLDAVTTVDVGSQVSGTISEIPVDFNSIVHKGEVLARLDTSLFQAQLEQARASIAKATADLGVAQAAVTDATEKLNRAKALAARQLIPQSDLDAAVVAEAQAEADVRAAAAARQQAQASVDQAEVNLAHAVIVSPIDGIVVARKVDMGQTVAASFQTPSLFSIAADLTKMQLKASVDESDVGKVAVGRPVRFSVDAYPGESFEGKVVQVRLEPQTVQNVVTYDTMIAVDNSGLLLKPGMTATAAIEVSRHDNVPRVPSLALRFRPTPAVLAALEEPDVTSKTKVRAGATPTPGSVGEVWVATNDRIEPRAVHVGLSDGQYTEIVDGISVGARVTTSAMLAAASLPRVAAPASPLAPVPAWQRR